MEKGSGRSCREKWATYSLIADQTVSHMWRALRKSFVLVVNRESGETGLADYSQKRSPDETGLNCYRFVLDKTKSHRFLCGMTLSRLRSLLELVRGTSSFYSYLE